MNARCRSPMYYTIIFTIKLFFVVSVIPIWPSYSMSSWEAQGTTAPFWLMIWSFADNLYHWGWTNQYFDFYLPGLHIFNVVIIAGLIIGRWRASRNCIDVNSK